MKNVKNKYTLLSILSVLSGVWSTVLLLLIGELPYFRGLPGSEENRRSLILMAVIYGVALLYDVWTFLKCKKSNQNEVIGKGYVVATIIGLLIFLIISGICTFAVSVVSITGGA